MDQFIRIPQTTLPLGVVPEFDVGVYLCSQVDGRAAVNADGQPWTRITYQAAVDACLAAGYYLLTETQWLAIAWRVCRVRENWAGYTEDESRVLQGIRKGLIKAPKPGRYNPSHLHEHRWLEVTDRATGSLCDLNGNAMQWVWDDVQGDENGLPVGISADSPSLTSQPYPRHTHGMGWSPSHGTTNRTDRGLCRGGGFLSGKDAGIYGLQTARAFGEYISVGFRATRPIS